MNNIEEDVMIKRLAEFVKVDLETLKAGDEYEEKNFITNAHKINGFTYNEITHFFSRIERPEFIIPEWIFKALKYNDAFYIQNIALIRATEWMRQEVYEKAKLKEKEETQNITNLELDYQKTIQKIQIANRCESKTQPDNTLITRFYTKTEYKIPSQYILKRAASDDSFDLPEIFTNNLKSDFNIHSKEVHKRNNTYSTIVIKIKPADIKKFSSENQFLYINIFSNGNHIDSLGPLSLKIIDNTLVEIKSIVPKSSLDKCAWGLSNAEPIDFYF